VILSGQPCRMVLTTVCSLMDPDSQSCTILVTEPGPAFSRYSVGLTLNEGTRPLTEPSLFAASTYCLDLNPRSTIY
jgi:hypothetical protein